MYGEAWGRVELLVADVALEVLCLLVEDEHLLVVELAVAVPDPRQEITYTCETTEARSTPFNATLLEPYGNSTRIPAPRLDRLLLLPTHSATDPGPPLARFSPTRTRHKHSLANARSCYISHVPRPRRLGT